MTSLIKNIINQAGCKDALTEPLVSHSKQSYEI